MKLKLQRITAAFGLLAAMFLAGCATAPSGGNVKPSGSSDAALITAVQPAISAANAEWPGAMRTHDAAALAAPFAETGALITAAGKTINGRTAIERYYREAFVHSPPIIDGEIIDDGIATSGNLVYVWGHGNYTVEHTPGQPSANSGYFLSVWQADAAGNWKIVRHLIF